MRERKREWFDPMTWPVRVRWALMLPVALATGAFVLFVYGTLNRELLWAPLPLMHAVLAACASIVFIFSAAYIAPTAKRWVAVVFALVPFTLAAFAISLGHTLHAGEFTTVGYGIGIVLGLFLVFTFRSEESVRYEPREPNPFPQSFPYRPK